MKYNKGFGAVAVLIAVVAALAVGGVAYYAGKTSQDIKKVEKSISAENPAVNNIENNPAQNNRISDDYSTYMNPLYGYSFNYKKSRFLDSKNVGAVALNDGDCVTSECATIAAVSVKGHVQEINELKTIMIKDLGANLSCSASNPTWDTNYKVNGKQTIQLSYSACAGGKIGALKTELGAIYNGVGYVISYIGMYGGEYTGEIKTEFDNLVSSFKFSNPESPVSENDIIDQPAYLKAVYVKNNKNYIDVDYIEVLNGQDALNAMVADGKCPDLKPGDCYLSPAGYKRNQNPKIRTFEVGSNVLINVYGSAGMTLYNLNIAENKPITFSKFLTTITSNNIKDDYITLNVKNNIVTKITEPYQE